MTTTRWLVVSAAVVLLASASVGGRAVYSQTSANPYKLTGRIVSVTDGDTVVMLRGRSRERIRLASIDAPEQDHAQAKPPRPGQPYGAAAQRFLAELVANQVLSARCFEQDHYGRHVCDVLLADGQTANRRVVEAGLAWANREAGGKFLRDATLVELERLARQARRGLWQSARPVPPWQWRYQCWRLQRCE